MIPQEFNLVRAFRSSFLDSLLEGSAHYAVPIGIYITEYGGIPINGPAFRIRFNMANLLASLDFHGLSTSILQYT